MIGKVIYFCMFKYSYKVYLNYKLGMRLDKNSRLSSNPPLSPPLRGVRMFSFTLDIYLFTTYIQYTLYNHILKLTTDVTMDLLTLDLSYM